MMKFGLNPNFCSKMKTKLNMRIAKNDFPVNFDYVHNGLSSWSKITLLYSFTFILFTSFTQTVYVYFVSDIL